MAENDEKPVAAAAEAPGETPGTSPAPLSGDPPAEPETPDEPSPPAEVPVADPDPPKPPPAPPAERRGFPLFRSLLLLLILAAAGWYGWQWWQDRGATGLADSAPERAQLQSAAEPLPPAPAPAPAVDAAAARSAELAVRIDRLEAAVQATRDAASADVAELRRELAAAGASEAADAERLDGLGARVATLEDLVAKLGERQASGLADLQLAGIEAILVQAGQRQELFHDGAGALAALRLAASELAAIDDPALAEVARLLDGEIERLAATRPQARATQVAELQELRGIWAVLPVKQAAAAPEPPAEGVWGRLRSGLDALVVVEREDEDAAHREAESRLAREVARIDLATAQAALLAGDASSATAALARVRATLAADYDAEDPAVQAMASSLAKLEAAIAAPVATPESGLALRALRNLRQVRRLGRYPATRP